MGNMETTSTTLPTGRTVFVPVPTRREEPQLEVLRQGNQVKTIRVSCTCGCIVDIDCEYDKEQDQGN